LIKKDVTVEDIKMSYHSLLRKYEHFEKNPVNQNVPDDFHHYYIFSVGKKGLCRSHEKFGRTDIRLWFKRIFINQPED